MSRIRDTNGQEIQSDERARPEHSERRVLQMLQSARDPLARTALGENSQKSVLR